MCFTNIVCRWPGSMHDSRIFDNSALCAKFERNDVEGILPGDGGYPCRRYLMTTVANPTATQEKNFNKAHIKTKGKVERIFGIWKQRFRCLRIPLRMRLQKSLVVIIATACVQNFAIQNGDFLAEEEALDSNSRNFISTAATVSGNFARQQIITNFY